MSGTSIVMHCDVVIRHIDRKLEKLDVEEKDTIDYFIECNTKPKRNFFIFTRPEITKEMAEKMLDEPYSRDRWMRGISKRRYILCFVNSKREKLNRLKRMCYDSCDGKITLSNDDYLMVMGK